VIRAFVAIDLPDDLGKDVQNLLASLQDLPDSGLIRWVKPQALHLTLAFLGNINRDRIPEIAASLQEAARTCVPFECRLTDLGAFPNWRKARILHLEVDDPTGGLKRIQHQVQSALSPLGFQPDRRAFSPHLTLGRVRDRASRRSLDELNNLVQNVRMPDFKPWYVKEIHFVQSDLLPSGPQYSRLGSFELD
jgi:2'-5' RNA ligase